MLSQNELTKEVYRELKRIKEELETARPKSATCFLSVSCQSGFDVQKRLVALQTNLQSINNIQDKQNKELCQQVSAMAISTLKELFAGKKTKAYENGFIGFFGIDRNDNRIRYVFSHELSSKITKNVYSLNNCFETDLLEEQLNYVEDNFIIMHMNGKEFTMHIADSNINLIETKVQDFRVQKQQKKGGQSAARIQRLAEESRTSALTICLDLVKKWTEHSLPKTKKIFVSGIDDWPKKLLKTLETYYPLQKLLHKEPLVFQDGRFNAITKNFRQLVINENQELKFAKFEQAYQEFLRQPDSFVFGADVYGELENKNIEQIFIIGKNKYDSIPIEQLEGIEVFFLSQVQTGTQSQISSLGNVLAKKRF